MNKRNLHRFFHENLGITPLKFIKEIKVQYARRLLENESLNSVEAVCNASGFITVRHFRKVFFDRFGKTPSSFFV